MPGDSPPAFYLLVCVEILLKNLRIIIVSTRPNLYNGLSFTTEHNQGRKNERAWAELRQISDKLCAEHGLSVIDPKCKGVSHYENQMQKEGKSWKDKLRSMLREIISYSRSFEEFLKNCTESGIEYVYTPQNKVKLKFKLSGEGQQRFTRADSLQRNKSLCNTPEPSAVTEISNSTRGLLSRADSESSIKEEREISLNDDRLSGERKCPSEPSKLAERKTQPSEKESPQKRLQCVSESLH